MVVHVHSPLHALAQTLLNLDELRRSHTHNIHKDDHTILCDSSIGRTHTGQFTHTHTNLKYLDTVLFTTHPHSTYTHIIK